MDVLNIKGLKKSFGDKVVLIVAAGDVKIDNPKYKAQFGTKAKMLSFDEAESLEDFWEE